MKVISQISKQLFIATFLCISILSACEKNKELRVEESVKSLEGNWRIVKATRNGSDLTAFVDFTKFRLNFNADSSYTIDNLLPFIVNKKGKYTLDDPKYPFTISFRQEGSSVAVTTGFSYPVVKGKRQISLSFSPGCQKNIYQYTFERIEP